MKNLPLHLKHRPRKFSSIIGQGTAIDIITGAVLAHNKPHTYLFHGHKGCGKTSLARIFAAALNCQEREPDKVEPCGKCPSCKSLGKGNNLDIKEINGANQNGVNDVRDLEETLHLAPISSEYKVIIIDECHQMSSEAQNCLLKVTEEPPNHVFFILITTEPQRIIPTLKSRALQIPFKRIDENIIACYLAGTQELTHWNNPLPGVAQIEGIELNQEQAKKICHYHRGSLRDCLQTLQQLKLGAKLESICPEPDINNFLAIIGQIGDNDACGLISLLDSLEQKGEDWDSFVSDFVAYLNREIIALGKESKRELEFYLKIMKKLVSAREQFNYRTKNQALQLQLNLMALSLELKQVSSINNNNNHQFSLN